MSVLPRCLAEPALRAGSLVLLHEPTAAPLNTLCLEANVGALTDPTLAWSTNTC